MNYYEEIIRLNEGDNTGARYSLMAIYALLEETDKMNKLLIKYPENSTPVHLFNAILDYKNENYDSSKKHLKEIKRRIPQFREFILGELDPEDLTSDAPAGYYAPYSMQEVFIYMNEIPFLFMNDSFIDFMVKSVK